MKITICTLFPEMFTGVLSNSIIKRAQEKGLVEIEVVNIRDYTKDEYGRVDTPPIGGGAGLIMKCQPIVDTLKAVRTENSHVILFSPRGEKYTQEKCKELCSLNKDIVLVAGHYEGVDERVNKYVDELISVGDYILTGGEIPAMVVLDSVVRLIDGVISKESLESESFDNGLLEYPQYTEPYDFNGTKVPDILYCGNHEVIDKYHLKESLKITRQYRPDLLENRNLSKQEKALITELDEGIEHPKWEKDAINKGKKFIKDN